MENFLVDMELLRECTEQYLMAMIVSPFSFGLLLGAVLEILGYGIFKAVSLLNIK